MKLFILPGACSMASHIVLEELSLKAGVPYQTVKLSADKGDLDKPEFLKLNSFGAVPVLEIEPGKVLTEGPAILQYLADLKPELKLAPKQGTYERTILQSRLNFAATEIHKNFTALFSLDYISKDEAAKKDIHAFFSANLDHSLTVYKALLGNQSFIMGNDFSIVDAYVFTLLSWSKMVKYDLSKHPDIVSYVGRIRERPSVLATLKDEGLM